MLLQTKAQSTTLKGGRLYEVLEIISVAHAKGIGLED